MQPALNLDRPRSSRIIGLNEVILRTHLSKTSVYRMIGLGLFPEQAKKLNGSRTAGWFEDDIDAWIEGRRPGKTWASQPPSESGKTVRSVPDQSIHAVDRQKTQAPTMQESSLVPTVSLSLAGWSTCTSRQIRCFSTSGSSIPCPNSVSFSKVAQRRRQSRFCRLAG